MLKQYKQIVHFLLTDKYVLYLTLAAALTNLATYAFMREYEAIVFFLIMGFIASAFSKNMIIIMLTAIISTFGVVVIKIFTKVREGFAAREAENESESEGEEDDAKKTENMQDLNPADFEEEPSKDAKKDAKKSKGASASASASASNSAKKNSAKKNSVVRSKDNIQGLDDSEGGVVGHKPKINYASTLEAAYDNLDKLLSSDALKNMSADTQRLASKQQNLMGNIEKLTPMITSAKGLLDNMNVDGMADKILSFQQKLGLGGAMKGAAAAEGEGEGEEEPSM